MRPADLLAARDDGGFNALAAVAGNARDRIWIDTECAVAMVADEPAAEGHVVIVPKEHAPSIHALPIATQQEIWALVSEVRARLRTGLVPESGFAIGFEDGLTADRLVGHTAIHVVSAWTYVSSPK